MSADDLVDGLTSVQCRQGMRLFLRAIEHHDLTGDHAWLARELDRIVTEVEVMAVSA